MADSKKDSKAGSAKKLVFHYVPDLPVLLSIEAKYNTLGSFALFYADMSDNEEIRFEEFGVGKKRIDDSELDMFTIPLATNDLHKFVVLIQGKYAPHPGNSELYVKYEVIQDEVSQSLVIDEKVDNDDVRYYRRTIEFKPKEK
ncbi:MAG: hypothetical protein R3F48_17005 [Candidatus Zixiibacteriota bacterium]